MTVLQVIPWLDILVTVLFLGLVALGFWQGLMRELWFLISLYLGAILASLSGDYVGGFIQGRLGAEAPEVASAWGFFIVLVFTTALLFTVMHLLIGHVQLPATLLVLDKSGGVVLGLMTGLIVTVFVVFVLDAIIPFGPEAWAFTSALKEQRERAPIYNIFLSTRHVILATIEPWLPADLPVFLRLPAEIP
jgi:uncharacterized membrane protein required for colicin V production